MAQIDTLIESVVRRLGEMLNERGPFQVSFEPLLLRLAHPGDQKAYLIRVQFPGVKSPGLIRLLDQKCAVRDVSYRSPHDFVSEYLLAVAESEWRQQLLPFVPKAPPAAIMLPQVQGLIASVWE